MSDNAKQMTIEELIVQRIKGDTLFAMVGDEDSLTKLAQKAVKELLFQPRFEPGKDRWGDRGMVQVPSVVQEAATSAAKSMVAAVIAEMTKELMEDPQLRKLVVGAIVAQIPDAITTRTVDLISAASQNAKVDAITAVQEAIRSRLIQLS